MTGPNIISKVEAITTVDDAKWEKFCTDADESNIRYGHQDHIAFGSNADETIKFRYVVERLERRHIAARAVLLKSDIEDTIKLHEDIANLVGTIGEEVFETARRLEPYST